MHYPTAHRGHGGGHSRLNITHPSSRQILGIMISNLHKATITAGDQVIFITIILQFFIFTHSRILVTKSSSCKVPRCSSAVCTLHFAEYLYIVIPPPAYSHSCPGISSPHPLRSITSRGRRKETLGQDTMTGTELLHF